MKKKMLVKFQDVITWAFRTVLCERKKAPDSIDDNPNSPPSQGHRGIDAVIKQLVLGQ